MESQINSTSESGTQASTSHTPAQSASVQQPNNSTASATSSACNDKDTRNEPVFRIRLHPQGNKESNKDFTFFQVFCSIVPMKYRAKFTVYNANGQEVPTTVRMLLKITKTRRVFL